MQGLWEQFSLGGRAERGAGIVYAVKYDALRLEAHRDAVIRSLEQRGCTIKDDGDSLPVCVPEAVHGVVPPLLEELAILNAAIEYHAAGIKGPVKTLCDVVELRARFLPIEAGEIGIVEAYDISSRLLGLMSALRSQQHSFSSTDGACIEQAFMQVRRAESRLNAPSYVIFG